MVFNISVFPHFFIQDGFLERLSSAEFVGLSRLVEKFATDCEIESGRKSMSLRGSLQSQVIINLYNNFTTNKNTVV